MNDAEQKVVRTKEPNEKERDPEGGHEIVDIAVNGEKVQVHRGRQSVAEIKRLGHVLQADILAEVVDGKLVDLANDGFVTIKGGEEFYSHPQNSGSSHR